MGKGNDELWNTVLRVELKPDPRLTEAQASVIAHDYGMEGSILKIQINVALVRYVLDAEFI